MKKQEAVADAAQQQEKEQPVIDRCCYQCTHFIELYTIPDTGWLDDMLAAYYAGVGACVRQTDSVNGKMDFRRDTESCEQFEVSIYYPKPKVRKPRFPTLVV